MSEGVPNELSSLHRPEKDFRQRDREEAVRCIKGTQNAKMIQKNENQNRNDFSWTYLRFSLFRVLAKQGDFDMPQPAQMCRLIQTFPVAPDVISVSCDDKHLLLYPEPQ